MRSSMIIFGLIIGLQTCGCTVQTDSDLRSQGTQEAEQDIAEGKLRLRTFGFPDVLYLEQYKLLLKEKFGAELAVVAGDVVDDRETEAKIIRAKAYNARMREEIAERFGREALAAVEREARQRAYNPDSVRNDQQRDTTETADEGR